MNKTQSVSDIDALNRDVLIAQLKNLLGALFLSNEVLEHIEKLIPFSILQQKVAQDKMKKTEVSELVIKYAKSLRKIVNLSRRGAVTEEDVEEAYNQLKSECPFCVKKSSAKK